MIPPPNPNPLLPTKGLGAAYPQPPRGRARAATATATAVPQWRRPARPMSPPCPSALLFPSNPRASVGPADVRPALQLASAAVSVARIACRLRLLPPGQSALQPTDEDLRLRPPDCSSQALPQVGHLFFLLFLAGGGGCSLTAGTRRARLRTAPALAQIAFAFARPWEAKKGPTPGISLDNTEHPPLST
jgi:hypothetical protein